MYSFFFFQLWDASYLIAAGASPDRVWRLYGANADLLDSAT